MQVFVTKLKKLFRRCPPDSSFGKKFQNVRFGGPPELQVVIKLKMFFSFGGPPELPVLVISFKMLIPEVPRSCKYL